MPHNRTCTDGRKRWRARTTAVARALLLLARAAEAGESAAPVSTRWIPAEQITHSRTNCGSSTIAVDGTGTTDIVYPDHEPGHADIYAVTRASSGKRSAAVNLSNTPGSSNFPAAARSATGGLHVVWQDDTPGNSQVYYAWRPLDGPWSTPENVSSSKGYADRPRIAVDRAGGVHVVWGDDSNDAPDVYYRSRLPGAGAWGPIEHVAATPGYSTAPTIAADDAGGLHVAWSDNTKGNFEIYYVERPAGAAWTMPENVSTNPGHSGLPALAVGNDGTVHVGWDDATGGNWEIRYRARPPHGSWNAARNISQTPGPIDNEDDPPALALGPDGLARVVWFDRSGPWAWDIYFARQTAGGSWTPSARITTGGHAFYPSLAVDAAGRAHVAWSAPGTPSTGQIFYVEETR